MKKQLFNILPILLCTVLSLKAYSQEDENFVRTIIPLIQTKTAVNSHTVSAHSAMVTTVYLDGLGRVKQQVLKSGSPTLEDLVTPVGYDKFGRQVKQYLPYPIAGTGNFREGAFLEQQEAYSSIYGAGQGMFASSEAQFEDSPLSRQLKQGAPGQAWQVTGEHAVETKYSARVTAGQVINFQVTEQPDPAKLRQIISRPVVNGMFWSTTSTDENNGTDREGIITTITNREGNTVLKKTWDGINFLYTYYLYDKLDRLAFVLPPCRLSGNG